MKMGHLKTTMTLERCYKNSEWILVKILFALVAVGLLLVWFSWELISWETGILKFMMALGLSMEILKSQILINEVFIFNSYLI